MKFKAWLLQYRQRSREKRLAKTRKKLSQKANEQIRKLLEAKQQVHDNAVADIQARCKFDIEAVERQRDSAIARLDGVYDQLLAEKKAVEALEREGVIKDREIALLAATVAADTERQKSRAEIERIMVESASRNGMR